MSGKENAYDSSDKVCIYFIQTVLLRTDFADTDTDRPDARLHLDVLTDHERLVPSLLAGAIRFLTRVTKVIPTLSVSKTVSSTNDSSSSYREDAFSSPNAGPLSPARVLRVFVLVSPPAAFTLERKGDTRGLPRMQSAKLSSQFLALIKVT